MTESKYAMLCSEVKKVLHYYAVFKHPLKVEEVHFNCMQKCSKEEIETVLKQLLNTHKTYNFNSYYTISESIENWIERRKKGEAKAKEVLPSAMRYGKFISYFPFVRFVGISGSLSKGFADEKSDYDFFIITARNRLWICRTILHIFKKLSFLFKLQHKFCMNYFVDEEHCEIEEKNLYTAIEISSMKAVAGEKHYTRFMQKNNWRYTFLPNGYRPFFNSKLIYNKSFALKRVFEFMINPYGDAVNEYLMKMTDNKWKRKWKRRNYPDEDYRLAFKTTLYQSKNHPANYQKKMLSKIEKIQPITS